MCSQKFNKQFLVILLAFLAAFLGPVTAMAAGTGLDLAGHWAGITSLVIFLVAYSLVIGEEVIHLQKSKPVIVAAGIIWVLVAIAYTAAGDTSAAEIALEHNLLEFVELF